jgi:hypothetical protein
VKNNASTLANLPDDLDNAFNSATYGSQQPDLILTDQKGEELLRAGMGTNLRYTDFKIGDVTINKVVFRGVPVLFDRHLTGITATPTGTGLTWSGTNDTATTHRYYLLNSNTFHFVWDSEWNMNSAVESGWRIPVDQFARVKLCCLRGQFFCDQRRYNSLVVNVPES